MDIIFQWSVIDSLIISDNLIRGSELFLEDRLQLVLVQDYLLLSRPTSWDLPLHKLPARVRVVPPEPAVGSWGDDMLTIVLFRSLFYISSSNYES